MEDKIKELEKQIAELKAELEKKTEVEQGRSEFDKPYYYIREDGVISRYEEEYDDYDDDCYEFGNYFKSEEEAEKIAKKIKAITKVTRAINKANGDWKPDWNNHYQDKFQIAFDSFDSDKMKIDWVYYGDSKQALSIPYIKDFTIAKKIIEEYEKELKIIFDIEE